MFRRSREPIIPSRAALHGLRASMNEPIVRIDGLPVAAARAAIALFDSGYGELSLAVAVDSREAAEPAFFVYQKPIDVTQAIEESLDVGVAFAEAMGFLFDEDMVAGQGERGRALAAGLWETLLGVAPARSDLPSGATFDPAVGLEEASGLDLDFAAPPMRGGTVIAFAGGGDALDDGDDLFELEESSILDEPLELEDELPASLDAPVPPAPRVRAPAGARESAMPRTTLTKFRGPTVVERVPEAIAESEAQAPAAPLRAPARAQTPAPEPAAADPAPDSGVSRLGRVAIVRRRVEGSEKRPSGLIRLLGSF